MSDPAITFGPGAVPGALSVHARQVLADLLRAAGCSSCVVSSTARSPEDQARVMWQNVLSQGMTAQLKLYRAPGRAVLDAGKRARDRQQTTSEILAAMTAEILRQGPGNVSHHCLTAEERAKLCVFDVAPSSITNGERWQAAVLAAVAAGRVSKFLRPPSDPGYHLEVPEPAT